MMDKTKYLKCTLHAQWGHKAPTEQACKCKQDSKGERKIKTRAP